MPPLADAVRTERLAALRATVARASAPPPLPDGVPCRTWRFGIASIDERTGALRPALHAFRASAVGDVAAAQGLALALIAGGAPHARLLWVTTTSQAREWGRPYPAGLRRFGIDTGRLTIVEARRAGEAGWAVEEGLKSGAFAAVLAVGLGLDFNASRRLSLMASEQGCTCFLVEGPAERGPLAATTLWRVRGRPALPDPFDPNAPGAAAWRVELLRARGRAPGGIWELAWDDATHRFALAVAPARGAAAPPARAGAAAEPYRTERSRAARA